MDDARSILLLLSSEYLCDTEYPRHFGSRGGPCTIYEATYRTFSTLDARIHTCTSSYTDARRRVSRDSVITAGLMDDRRRARIRNTASVSFVFV